MRRGPFGRLLKQGRPEVGLLALSLRLSEDAHFIPAGTCAALAAGAPRTELPKVVATLRARTQRVLPPLATRQTLQDALDPAVQWELAALYSTPCAVEDLCSAFELVQAQRLTSGRRPTGLYYTPPAIASHLVALALAHGSVKPAARHPPLVVDPCCGAGVLLVAAARALTPALGRALAPRMSGSDLDGDALAVARAALALLKGPQASARDLCSGDLAVRDSLRSAPAELADLLVTNPPYGHLADPRERAFLSASLPALRGGEVDRYAAFLLRSLSLVRPGGTAALLVPDTWMTNLRMGPLRLALLDRAELACVADLGKPFTTARDTRVMAVVLVRSDRPRARSRPTASARLHGGRLVALLPLQEASLRASAKGGWHPYRSESEQRLCDALEKGSVPLGSVCEVGYGLRTGDNARHVGRGPLWAGGLPLVGGEDLVPFGIHWKEKYLRSPTSVLSALASRQLGRPRVAIQRIRTNSAKPGARWLEAALVSSDQLCLDSLSTLAARPDADDPDGLLLALLGLFGSVALDRAHRLRTTDVNVKPSALRTLPVPRAILNPQARAALVALVRARRSEVPSLAVGRRAPPPPRSVVERALDAEVYALYGLCAADIETAERGHWGDRATEPS